MGVVWFFCLGGLGSFFPYFSLYLHENAGLDGAQVGRVLAILPLVGILAQPLWGQLADRTGSRSRVLALLALGAGLGYAALALPRGFAAIALATAGLAIFAMPLIPSCVSVTLALVRDSGPHAFGLARVWGTVGFLLVVVGFPFLLDAWQSWRGLAVPAGGPEPGMQLMFPLTGALVAIAGLVALRLPRTGAVALRAPRGDWRRLLRHGPYLRVLLFVMAAYACVQGPMLLFPVFVRSHGGSPDAVSRMWILMLLLEIPLIALSRWAVCGFAPDLRWVYPVQVLHGVVVAGLVLGGPLYAEAVVPERLRATGQGVLAMFGVSIGGIASSLAAGWLLARVGPSAPYVAGGIGALALGALIPWLLPAPHRPEPAPGEAAQESITRS
jgi:PPP family 3-phenylpropionic acid transporter